MRRFNPEKELNKIQHGNKNKILYGIILLLLIISIGSTYALYQVRYSKRIIYTKVADFSRDINLSVFIDNNKVDDFPTKTQGKVYDKIVCDNNTDNHVSAYWDYDKWGLVVETTKKAKCNVYFKTGTDTSGANPPELYQGLIPVTIDTSGTVKVADTSKEWYNYDKKQWANAVLVDSSKYSTYNNKPNTTIPMTDILQMYVWIPRYKYELFNAVNGESKNEQMINVKFETNTETTGRTKCEIAGNGKENCVYDDNGEWFTHPAFTFGDTELTGIWVGKFETSHTTKSKGTTTTDANAVLNCTTTSCSESDYIRIIPNVPSLRYNDISNFFYVSRSIEKSTNKYNLNSSEIDTHMMKNMEWGAMAYLTQSKYGRCESNGICTEIATSGNTNYMTGYANTTDQWNTTNGMKTSTTGNIYGIYDAADGAWEYIMGNMVDANGAYNPRRSALESISDAKYYDKYEYGNGSLNHEKGHLGDATRETSKKFGDALGEWYDGSAFFPSPTAPWFNRGGSLEANSYGIFGFGQNYGSPFYNHSFRIILTAQDGDS